MRKTADAVIIGGGALGSSILYHLTQKGLRNVVLLEKGELASGSTGDSAAMVRQHYSNEVSIYLVKKSLEIFQNFPDMFDGTEVFTNSGWYFLVSSEASEHFHENLAQLQRLGVRTWEVEAIDAAKEIPSLNTADIEHVAFEPDSGYADPCATVKAFAAKAEANGAEVCIQTSARDIKLDGSRVSAIITDQGEICTPIVINAAGPWAKEVGRWTGLNLPLEITREPEAVFRPPEGMLPLHHPVSNTVDRTYFRPMIDGTIMIGTGHPKESELADPDHYQRNLDEDFIQHAKERLAYRLTGMSQSTYVDGWAGLYTVTPDWNMILDKSPDVDGLYLAVGGSGHSFKLAPAMGLCLAELIVEGTTSTIDITPLRATRFEENDLLLSTYGGNRG